MVTHVAIRFLDKRDPLAVQVLQEFTTCYTDEMVTLFVDDTMVKVQFPKYPLMPQTEDEFNKAVQTRELVKDADYIVDRDYGDENL